MELRKEVECPEALETMPDKDYYKEREGEKFLKKHKILILASLTAVLLAPAAAIDLNSSSSLRYFPDSGPQEFAIDTDGNLNMTGDNITNFFDQGKCGDDEAIKTVYPNGSYACNSISTTTQAENLSETLSAGNDFGDNNVDVEDQNITSSNGNVTIGSDLKVYGNVWTQGEPPVDTLSEVLEAGNVANQSISMQDETISFNNYNIYGGDGIQIGDSSTSVGSKDGVALGPGADTVVSGSDSNGSIAIGLDSYAESDSSGGNAATSIGRDAYAYGWGATALGRGANASDDNAVAIGRSTEADSAGTAVGERAESADSGTALGVTSYANGDAVSVGTGSDAGGTDSVAIGLNANAPVYDTVAIGQGANATAIHSTAIQEGAKTEGEDAIAIGRTSAASAQGSVAIGHKANAPNSYEATFGNLQGEELDFNVTGNLTVHGSDGLDLNGNDLRDVGAVYDDSGAKCGTNEFLNGEGNCQSASTSAQEAENLSETLAAGNVANQSINLSGNNITDARKIEFQDAGGDILNVDQLSLSEGSSDFRLRVGGEKFLDEGFEDNSISPFQNDPDGDVSSTNQVPWSTTSNTPYGSYAAQAQDTGDDEVAEMETTVSGGNRVVFKYYLDTTSDYYDEAYVETQSGRQKFLDNTSGKWVTRSLEVSPGSTQLEFKLDGSFNGGDETTDFRVDEVRVFNTTEDAVSVYGSQTLNTGDLNQVNRINFVQGVEVGQGTNATDFTGTAVGRGAEALDTEASAFGSGSSASGISTSAFGSSSSASGDRASVFGYSGSASGDRASVFGYSGSASADSAVAIGDSSSASAENAVATGWKSSASADRGSAFGVDSSASGNESIALGAASSSSQNGSVALGGGASADAISSVAIGAGSVSCGQVSCSASDAASASGDYSVALGANTNTSAKGAVAVGRSANAPNKYEATFGNLQGEELDVNVTGNLTVHQRAAFGDNSVSGLSPGDINASDIYYDTLTAKSPVVSCSQGSSWCEVSEPEKQSHYFVKTDDSFDKDRPRETAVEVVESDVETVEEFEKLREENQRQEEKIQELNSTVRGLKSVVCEDSPDAEVCQ